MRQRPLFSIIIPTYNRPKELIRSLESIAQQQIKNIEVIVVDDGSKQLVDTSLFKKYEFKIDYILKAKNQGAASARNTGIKAASGEYISFLDDDDEFCKDFLADSLAVLEQNPHIALTWCAVLYISDGQEYRYDIAAEAESIQDQHALFQKLLSVGIGHGVTIRAALLDMQQGLFDEKFKLVEDTDFFLKFLADGLMPFYIANKANVRVHNHDKLRMTSAEFNQLRIYESKILLQKHAGFFSNYPFFKQQLEYHIVCLQSSLNHS
jgi:glycosyltransferase involved in cell wall biosynthesis